MEQWAEANCMKFNKEKLLRSGDDNSRKCDKLGAEWLENGPVEKDLGVLNMSQLRPGGQEDQWHPGFCQKQHGHQGRDSTPLPMTGAATP
ncbi:hypothetical protein DUI87_08838 [Hirundo rustica rustica]|uniref:Rna-directed dna polymerase from mobile element jockey-like n=1 Tax=Hirundo rustica rustica TaxID=333673 RepID=A0A3M0KL07_HIRRU|nr:hypothetical protein DUI87_08838 [Hirundo rustica rustica]